MSGLETVKAKAISVPCRECRLQQCPGLRPLDPAQLLYMERFKQGETRLVRGDIQIAQGATVMGLHTIYSGVLLRYLTLEDGRRQIVNFMFPGDLVGLQGVFAEPSSHTIEALTDARLCNFTRSDFHRLIVEHPELGYDMTWLAAKEERSLEEHIVSLGQRTARERVVYLAVWLLDRALGTGVAQADNVLNLPITQAQIGDMLGLSLVHTNRTIKGLEREGLLHWKGRGLTIPDMDAACEVAHFSRAREHVRPFI